MSLTKKRNGTAKCSSVIHQSCELDATAQYCVFEVKSHRISYFLYKYFLFFWLHIIMNYGKELKWLWRLPLCYFSFWLHVDLWLRDQTGIDWHISSSMIFQCADTWLLNKGMRMELKYSLVLWFVGNWQQMEWDCKIVLSSIINSMDLIWRIAVSVSFPLNIKCGLVVNQLHVKNKNSWNWMQWIPMFIEGP